MGRIAKAKRADQRRRFKRAAKAQKKAVYASLRGTSKKSKKVLSRAKGKNPNKHQHLVENCGNIGCASCYPQYQRTIWNGRVIENGKAVA